MGLLAEYEIAFEHLPLVTVANSIPQATLIVDVGQPNQGGPPPFFLRISGAGSEPIETALHHACFVDEYSLLGTDGEDSRYQIVPARTMDEQIGPHVNDVDTLRSLARNDSIVERIEVTTDGWQQQRWFADRPAFDRYRSFWQDNAESFSLYRLVDTTTGPDRDLTVRQREALLTAYEMGYFDIPRRASLREIASELGITSSSLSERLRRAQSHVIEFQFADSL